MRPGGSGTPFNRLPNECAALFLERALKHVTKGDIRNNGDVPLVELLNNRRSLVDGTRKYPLVLELVESDTNSEYTRKNSFDRKKFDDLWALSMR